MVNSTNCRHVPCGHRTLRYRQPRTACQWGTLHRGPHVDPVRRRLWRNFNVIGVWRYSRYRCPKVGDRVPTSTLCAGGPGEIPTSSVSGDAAVITYPNRAPTSTLCAGGPGEISTSPASGGAAAVACPTVGDRVPTSTLCAGGPGEISTSPASGGAAVVACPTVGDRVPTSTLCAGGSGENSASTRTGSTTTLGGLAVASEGRAERTRKLSERTELLIQRSRAAVSSVATGQSSSSTTATASSSSTPEQSANAALAAKAGVAPVAQASAAPAIRDQNPSPVLSAGGSGENPTQPASALQHVDFVLPNSSVSAEDFPALPLPATPHPAIETRGDLASRELVAALERVGPQLREGARSVRALRESASLQASELPAQPARQAQPAGQPSVPQGDRQRSPDRRKDSRSPEQIALDRAYSKCGKDQKVRVVRWIEGAGTAWSDHSGDSAESQASAPVRLQIVALSAGEKKTLTQWFYSEPRTRSGKILWHPASPQELAVLQAGVTEREYRRALKHGTLLHQEGLPKKLFASVWRLHGAPMKIVCDRDPRFRDALTQEFMRLMGVKVASTTPYHPQSDGQAERSNHTVERMLRCYVAENQEDWDLWVAPVEYAINDSKSAVTGFSPFELVYGHAPATQLDLFMDAALEGGAKRRKGGRTAADKQGTAHQLAKQFAQQLQAAREGLQMAQQRMMEQFDARHRLQQYKVNDQVWVDGQHLTLPGDRGLKPKLRKLRHGPLRVVECLYSDRQQELPVQDRGARLEPLRAFEADEEKQRKAPEKRRRETLGQQQEQRAQLMAMRAPTPKVYSKGASQVYQPHLTTVQHPVRILVLFCGTGSVEQQFQRQFDGCEVVTVDILPKWQATCTEDVLHWNYGLYPRHYFDVIWASPPCKEYSKAKTRGVPDLELADRRVVYVEDTRLRPRTVWAMPTDSDRTLERTRTERGVTYCAILDSPNGVTGELRSCLNAVYATCAIAESLLRSAIISDRIRSCPPVLTRVKTDAAFDDRELTSLNSVSDVRSVLAFENMALRNEIDAATHRALNDNNKAHYQHAGHAEIDDRLAQTTDPMRHSNFVPTVIPLPVDAEVATYSLPAMRSDLAGFQRHAEREIVHVFGMQDDRISLTNIDPFRRDEIQRLLSAVCKNVWRQSPPEFGERFPTTSVDAARFEFPRTPPTVDAVAPDQRGSKKRTRHEDRYDHFNY
ncbi:hypothetical protein CYMTET_15685 [Cymbomonas tetramitiformis]|uniref:Integrase catalytic domain-containing protein n=1 Tax=Cymbomonas tetramitiformis TaxID=36881 RepID=A0AAE0L917_9CHLO|nr:hypothetical protein CYMTET_15685 [Cymbomonas tetramitiformis]